MGKPPKPPTQDTLRVLKRRSIVPVHFTAGCQMTQQVSPDGLLQDFQFTASEDMTFTETILFETTFEGRRAIGGFLLADS